MSNNIENNKKNLEIITGDGKNLNFSPVFNHLNSAKPKTKDSSNKNTKIIIPEVKNKSASN